MSRQSSRYLRITNQFPFFFFFSTAKEKKQFLYAQQENVAGSKGRPTASGPSARNQADRSIEGQVIRVWSGDQVSIVDKDSGKERRLQLSSTRAPK